MLTDKDIEKIIEANKKVFATREELVDVFSTKDELTENFASKGDFEDLRQDFRILQSSIDTYAQKADTYFQEMLMLANKVDRMEKWIHQIAEKTGIKLAY